MFIRDGVTYAFHHMGIPTHEPRAGERYSTHFRKSIVRRLNERRMRRRGALDLDD
ncbi:hypothetical protein AWB75_02354 [Caballeronia catudaia]|uniref:Uncharacterized protein n=1 Tax=Caballeronia catudaia TaxID=1777136 RepID=A0A158ALH3_9BURK|nr:hypothetical protein AWB75_02354 [Caballeronia catudaia]